MLKATQQAVADVASFQSQQYLLQSTDSFLSAVSATLKAVKQLNTTSTPGESGEKTLVAMAGDMMGDPGFGERLKAEQVKLEMTVARYEESVKFAKQVRAV